MAKPGCGRKFRNCRDSYSVWNAMGSPGYRLRYVVRTLLRSPMFSLITIITIAIGIGANAAIFSIVNGILLKPLAYPHSDRLIAVRETSPVVHLAGSNELD